MIDDYNREILHIDLDTESSGEPLWKPEKIRMDNGPEFISYIAEVWSLVNEISFACIQPCKPTQNAYIERLSKTYRDQILDAYIFVNLEGVRSVTKEWVKITTIIHLVDYHR